MKKFLLVMAAGLIAVLLPILSYSQSSLPAGFKDQVQEEYDKMKHKDVSFDYYYQLQVADYQLTQFLKANPSQVYMNNLQVVNPVDICGNGDFEGGLLTTQWDAARGSITNAGAITYGNLQTGFASGALGDTGARQTLVVRVLDSVLNSLGDTLWTTCESTSQRAVRIGNARNGSGVELLSKTFVVTNANSLITFRYAVVQQNPDTTDHTPAQQPAFRVRILNNSNGNAEVNGLVNLGNNSNVAWASAANTQFYKNAGNLNGYPVVYRPWSCVQINLASLIGDTVTIQLVNNDCSKSGHFGYTYIDNFCGNCGDDNPAGAISFNAGASTTCGVGQICCNFTAPVSADGSDTGTVKPVLRMYQNGVQVAWIAAPTYDQDGSHCFAIDPAALGITGDFDYVIEGLFTLNGNLPTQLIGNLPTGQDDTLNDDYRINCPVKQCCPGTNYIKNGTFTSLISTFTSDYTYQAPGTTGAVGTGEHSVMTAAEALANSPTWIGGCPDYGRALYINGATEMSTGPKVMWRQTSGTLTPGNYRFCVDLRNLPQCDFNAPSRVTLSFVANGPAPILYGSSTITLSGSAGCNWTTLMRNLSVPAGVTSLQVTLSLTETAIGDGNDVAIDNINLTRLDTVTAAQAHFTHTTSNVTSSTYNITANATAALDAGCTRFWQVEEVTSTTTPGQYNVVAGTQVINPPSWQSINPNTFIGYNGTSTLSGTAPGVFQVGKLYRIFYSADCPCMTRRMTYHVVSVVLRPGFPPTPIPVDSGVVDDPGPGEGQGRMAPGTGVNGINVFPNPTDNKVTVQMEPLQSGATLKVLSLSGQELKSIALPAKETQADISLQELPAGTYLLQMTSRTGEKLLNYKISRL